MRYWLFYALKDLNPKGQHRITFLITLLSWLGVTLAVAVILVVLSVVNGLKTEFVELLVRMTPHVAVTPRNREILYDYESTATQIEEVPGVEKVYPFLSTQILVSGAGGTEGAILHAIPEEADVPHRTSALRAGVIIGENLADAVGVQTGQEVALVSSSGKRGTFTVTGIFSSGLYQYDYGLVYLLLSRAQEFMGLGEGVTGLQCKVIEPIRAWNIAQAISQALPPTYRANSWDQINRNVLLALSLQKRALLIILFSIILIAEILVISSLMVRISEKTKEIGILNAIGVTRKGIMSIFVAEGTSIAAIGTASGCILAILLCSVIRRFPLSLPQGFYGLRYLPVRMELSDFLLISILTVGVSFLASLYPAQKAASLDPAEALRYD